jgi:hypothetical protein
MQWTRWATALIVALCVANPSSWRSSVCTSVLRVIRLDIGQGVDPSSSSYIRHPSSSSPLLAPLFSLNASYHCEEDHHQFVLFTVGA